MIKGASPGYVQKQLKLADEALNDAKFLFENGRLNSTANRAYYAMFHAAQAALAVAEAEMPSTHLGVMTVFTQEYVRSGRVDRRFARDLRDNFELRQDADYGPAGITNRQAERAVAKADKFVDEVKRLVGV